MSVRTEDIEKNARGLGYVVVHRDEKEIVFARTESPVARFKLQPDGTVLPDDDFSKNMDAMITDVEKRFPSIARLAPR